jgi:hypothetical protein
MAGFDATADKSPITPRAVQDELGNFNVVHRDNGFVIKSYN